MCCLTNGVTLRELRRSGRLVGRDGDLADEDLELGNDHVGRHLSGNGVGSCMRSMAVDDGLCLRHVLVDFKMQVDFAGAGSGSGNLISIEIDHAKSFWRQIELAHHGWRAENLVGPDAIGNVAAVAIDKLAQPELAPDSANLLFDGIGFRRVEETRVGCGRLNERLERWLSPRRESPPASRLEMSSISFPALFTSTPQSSYDAVRHDEIVIAMHRF